MIPSDAVRLGAVAYDRKVVDIWDTFLELLQEAGLDFDYVLFTSYEAQVRAHLDGVINVAWNSPLAWIQAERAAARRGRSAHALVMRDTDQDLTSVVLVRADGPRTVGELAGGTLATGALDSPQAHLIPLEHLAQQGLALDHLRVLRHDRMLGKHGDHVGGEREAAQALREGRADAACILDANLGLFAREGVLPAGSVRVLTQTAPYDHCNFTALDEPGPGLVRFVELLLAMRYDDPRARPALDLEGLKRWLPGRTSGYAALHAACDRLGALSGFLAAIAPG